MKAPWFEVGLSHPDGLVRFVLLQPPPELPEWRPEILLSPGLPEVPFAGRPVTLEGKAPMWAYAAVTAFAVRAGASQVSVLQPHETSPVPVFPLPSPKPPLPAAPWFGTRFSRDDGVLILEFRPHPEGGRWSPDVLSALAGVAESWNDTPVILTGRGANWMYAASAAEFARHARRPIGYFSPANQNLGIYWISPLPFPSASFSLVQVPPPSLLPPDTSRGQIVGVLGDPNSGKSVFSGLLHMALAQTYRHRVWKLDCDHAAPTPDWYLEMLRSGAETTAKELRQGQKRKWTPEAELLLARKLENCARCLDWTIADLPGGNHASTPPQRIPPGRDDLFRVLDLLVLVVRGDQPESELGWREALRLHGLDDRIALIVESVEPASPLSVTPLDGSVLTRRFRITGLDRKRLDQAVFSPLAAQWKPLTDDLVRWKSHRA